jgi:spore coat polysaccharide biosynthesis protein SpsF
MKILAITQARYGSSRLPGKVLKMVNGESLLQIHLRRILTSGKISKLKVATTTEPDADKIIHVCESLGIEYYQGSVNDVLDRFYKTAEPENPDWIVRLTSDCPLIDSEVINEIIECSINKNLDYTSNGMNPTYPDGLDVEVFKYSALKQAYAEATLKSDREHVTPYIWRNSSFKGGEKFSSFSFEYAQDLSQYRLTVDTTEDFEVIEKLIMSLGADRKWNEYIDFLDKNPSIRQINQRFKRNEGYQKSLKED